MHSDTIVPKIFDLQKIRLWYLLIGLGTCLFIWQIPVVPFQDLPVWTYEGVIFKEALLKEEFSRSFEVLSFPIPNSITVFLLGIFYFAFSYVVAQKIMLSMYIALFLFSTYYFLSVFTSGNSRVLFWIAPLYLFNNSMFWGNISNNFGNCFFLLFVAYIYARKAEKRVSVFLLLFLSAGIFFSHGLTIFAIIPFIISQILTNPNTQARSGLILSLSSLGFLCLFYVGNYQGSSSGFIWENRADTATFSLLQKGIRFMGSFVIPLSPLVGDVSHSYPLLSEGLVLLNFLNFAFLSLFVLSRILTKERLYRFFSRENIPLTATLFTFLFYILILPDFFMGIVGAGRRFTLLFLFLLCALLGRTKIFSSKAIVPMTCWCIFIVSCQFFLYSFYWIPNTHQDVFKQEALSQSYISPFHKWYLAFSVDSTSHLKSYQAIERHEVCDCFDTSIIRRKKE